MIKNVFSPIYDSGCCLGRELIDDKVEKMINNDQMINAYIRRGKSEIHWEGYSKKLNHFDLLNLLKKEYPEIITKIIQRVKTKYKKEKIKEVIYNVDNNLPEYLKKHKLSENRKILMLKLVTLRIDKLFKLE